MRTCSLTTVSAYDKATLKQLSVDEPELRLHLPNVGVDGLELFGQDPFHRGLLRYCNRGESSMVPRREFTK